MKEKTKNTGGQNMSSKCLAEGIGETLDGTGEREADLAADWVNRTCYRTGHVERKPRDCKTSKGREG